MADRKHVATAGISGIEGRRRAALDDANENYSKRREQIIEVAAHLFRELGYEVTTLKDVAARLGTDRASLYYYFSSKDALFQAVVRDVLERNVAAATKIKRRRLPGRDKIAALIEDMIVSFDKNYPQVYVYIEDMGHIARQDSDWAHAVIRSSKVFESIVISILEEAKQQGAFDESVPVDLAALALFGMINWTCRWYQPGSKYSPEEVARSFTTIFLDGVSR